MSATLVLGFNQQDNGPVGDNQGDNQGDGHGD
jgi:hypothetical protein